MTLRIVMVGVLAAPLGLAAAGASKSAMAQACRDGDASSASCDASMDPSAVSLLQHSAGARGGLVAGGASHLGRATGGRGAVEEDAAEATRSSLSDPAASWPNPSFSTPMTDVQKSFESLAREGEVFAASAEGFPEGYDKGIAPYAEHFEGVQRYKNFIYVSGAGEKAKKSQIFVFEIGSKTPTERFASSGDLHLDPKDKFVKAVEFDPENNHAGGFTIYGDILVVGSEKGCSVLDRMGNRCEKSSKVHFFDLADPRDPKMLDFSLERDTDTAGAVSLTQEPDGRFLLVVGNTDSNRLDFYRSEEPLETFPKSSDPGFKLAASWDKAALLVSPGLSSSYLSYQNLNFIRQVDGSIFILGTTRTMFGGLTGADTADLFLLDNKATDSMTLTKVASREFACHDQMSNFAAGAAPFVESPEKLMMYAVNWEPLKGKTAILVNEFHPSTPSPFWSFGNYGGYR